MNAALASRLIPWFQICLIDKHADWYRTNGYYRFKKGDRIKLRSKASFGFGTDPKGTVVDLVHEKNNLGEMEDFYVIQMDCYDYDYHKKQYDDAISFDSDAPAEAPISWLYWFRGKKLPKGHRRVVKRQRYFKWNIEYHFKKAR
jgi:hypothetical protein